jgi:hypothetical protein
MQKRKPAGTSNPAKRKVPLSPLFKNFFIFPRITETASHEEVTIQ